jgi:hypothetical protein
MSGLLTVKSEAKAGEVATIDSGANASVRKRRIMLRSFDSEM